MPITYCFDPESGILRTRCLGEISLDDTLEHFDQVASDPRLPDGCKALLDLDQLVSVPATGQVRDVVHELGRRLKQTIRFGPWAIVAERDAVYGMSRMFQVFLEQVGIESRVFRSTDEALRWLESGETPGG
jgi:hypothetical protein